MRVCNIYESADEYFEKWFEEKFSVSEFSTKILREAFKDLAREAYDIGIFFSQNEALYYDETRSKK